MINKKDINLINLKNNLDKEIFFTEEENFNENENFYIKEVEKISENEDIHTEDVEDSSLIKMNSPISNRNAKLIKYIKDVFSIPNLTNEEEISLMKNYFEKKDIESGRKIIASHLKLVVKLCFKYKNYTNSLFDLFSEGNLGLMHALKKFDPVRGVKFATYATFWIRSYIQDYIIRTWSSIKNKSKDIKKKLFSNSSDRENIKIEKEISLERATYNDENQIYQIEESENFVDVFLNKDKEDTKRKIIKDAILTLDPRAIFILQERFLKETKMTLSELSEKLKISKERIRQIEEKSIESIKKYIKDFGCDI